MNDCFPVAYVFNTPHNHISYTARTTLEQYLNICIHAHMYNILLLENDFFHFSSGAFEFFFFFYVFPSSLRFANTLHISRAGYCIFIFHVRASGRVLFATAGEKGFSDRLRSSPPSTKKKPPFLQTLDQ